MTEADPPPPRGVDLDAGELTGLRPDRLLEHARQLAQRGRDTPIPRTVHARRAVSAAYYALFHRVAINVAWRASTEQPDDVRWRLCRTINHGDIGFVTGRLIARSRAAGRSGSTTLETALLDSALVDSRMPDIASGFDKLMRARHQADYDHLVVIDRPTALLWVSQAGQLVRQVDELWPEPAWQSFTTLVLLKASLSNRA